MLELAPRANSKGGAYLKGGGGGGANFVFEISASIWQIVFVSSEHKLSHYIVQLERIFP